MKQLEHDQVTKVIGDGIEGMEFRKYLGKVVQEGRLSARQTNYLVLRAMGLQREVAQKAVGVNSSHTIDEWRKFHPDIYEAEGVFRDHPGWREEARLLWVAGLKPQALAILNHLLDQGLAWEKLDKVQQQFVFKAMALVLQMAGTEESREKSYEEIVFKLRRVARGAAPTYTDLRAPGMKAGELLGNYRPLLPAPLEGQTKAVP